MCKAAPHRVAIVGGGASGALVAAALLRHPVRRCRMTIYEPGAELGRGVAYSTREEHHLLNVPAGRMSAFTNDPDHFVQWARGHGHAPDRGTFLPRRAYGDYLGDVLRTGLADPGQHLRHVRQRVEALAHRRDESVELRLGDGRTDVADTVVLAIGGLSARPLRVLPTNTDSVVLDPWAEGALAGRVAPSPTLVIGTGLTAVDAVLSVCAADPDNRVVAVSRGGRFPFAHLPGGVPARPPLEPPAWERPFASLPELEAALHLHIARAQDAGADWRDAVDSVRPITPRVWRELPHAARKAFIEGRSLRAWELRRHRTAPAAARRLEELRHAGRLEVLAGEVTRVAASSGAWVVDVSCSDAPARTRQLRTARVVACTGPGMNVDTDAGPLLRRLLGTGQALADELGLGVRTDERGCLVRSDGGVTGSLLVVGALRRGELWESTAIPEIRTQAETVAAHIRARSRCLDEAH